MARALRPVNSPAPPEYEPIAIEAVLYWRLRAHMRDHEAVVAQCQAQIIESKRALDADMASCGLDPSKRYRLEDAMLSAVEVP